MKKVLLLSTLLLSFVFVYAQDKTMPVELNDSQAASVAKVLRQHNIMINFCGCCDRSTPEYIQIKKVTVESNQVIVVGTNIVTNKEFNNIVDAVKTWVPLVVNGQIKQIDCVAVKAGINCDPCTVLAAPRGEVADKVLSIEKDGLLDYNGGNRSVEKPVAKPNKVKDLNVKEAKSTVIKDNKRTPLPNNGLEFKEPKRSHSSEIIKPQNK